MSDHDEIRGVLQRYARAADERDLEALEALFHPEAEITGANGTSDRTAWLAAMAAPRAFPQSMHLVADPLIEMDRDGDGDLARVDTYAVVYQLAAPGEGADLTLGIRYLDEMVRTDGCWVIRRRVSMTRWMR